MQRRAAVPAADRPDEWLSDPFDARVVEAYWIGNDLLEGVEARQLYASLQERFASQLTPRTRQLVLGKAPAGAHPQPQVRRIAASRTRCRRSSGGAGGWPGVIEARSSGRAWVCTTFGHSSVLRLLRV
ncbi:MAG TPA: DUF6390 family protein [Chloroflexota bacterium]